MLMAPLNAVEDDLRVSPEALADTRKSDGISWRGARIGHNGRQVGLDFCFRSEREEFETGSRFDKFLSGAV